MDAHVVLPLRGEVLTIRRLTNGVQQYLLVIEMYLMRLIFGIYSWNEDRIVVAEFLMGTNRLPEGIGMIHGVIREVGRSLRRGSRVLVIEHGGGRTWYILYDWEDGGWVIDEVLTEVVVAPDAAEVSDEE
jgi:hypothetical protein